MFEEAKYIWNHALALQKRYYKLYGRYIKSSRLQHHFAVRYKRNLIGARTVQGIIMRLDKSYKRFFNKESKRTPKFKRKTDNISLEFKRKKGVYLDCCSIHENYIRINVLNKKYKFFKSREYKGNITRVFLKKYNDGNYFITIETEAIPEKKGKTHNGASVGIDFGLKHYLTLSNGIVYDNPNFLKKDYSTYSKATRSISKSEKGSRNRERKRIVRNRIITRNLNKKNDYQWKLAHKLCLTYDYIFLEDLNIIGMRNLKNCRTKLKDYSHASFVEKLCFVANKYSVVIHKIDRYFPSSKLCHCGYIKNDLSLDNRHWNCPKCGANNDRDKLAAENILRRGIYELESDNKASKHSTERQSR